MKKHYYNLIIIGCFLIFLVSCITVLNYVNFRDKIMERFPKSEIVQIADEPAPIFLIRDSSGIIWSARASGLFGQDIKYFKEFNSKK